MVKLRPMREKEYQFFIKYSSKHVSDEQVKYKKWTESDAKEWLKTATLNILPQGKDTLGHVFFRILNIQEIPIGFMWLFVQLSESTAHINDMMIEENHRRRGYARSALKHLGSWCLERGIITLTLHLFPGNAEAHNLYIRCGFSPQNNGIWVKELNDSN